ncbi:MAG TPA: DUF4157 domain-containing protein [Polyangiaceae bacterium]|jgi:hypothetical protein
MFARLSKASPGPEVASPRLAPTPAPRAPSLETTATPPHEVEAPRARLRPYSFGSIPVHAPAASSGAALDATTRASMEARLGHDFRDVRVHTGADAAGAAQALDARAFTAGRDIVFGAGAYAPSSEAGDGLLAHELTHVVQQARFGSAAQASPLTSGSRDAAEQEADRVGRGETSEVRQAPSARVARQGGPGAAPSGPAPFLVFEGPSATTQAGAVAAFDKYLALSASAQAAARRWSYGTGSLKGALAALGDKANAPKYAGAVHAILRWIEETETRATTGKTDAQIEQTQAPAIHALSAAPPGWGGTAKPRWAGLLDPAKKAWTARGNKAIDAMVKYASSAAPELKLTKATFELAFDAVDRTSLGALATGGSTPGKTVRVGFEFVVTVEVNPAYALSTVVHELRGHPMYDEASGSNYAGKLYEGAAAKVPASKKIDRTGTETFAYWPSETYSLLKEIPYWTKTSAADAAKPLALPGSTNNAASLNYDPRGEIEHNLQNMKSNWEPSLVNGIVRGFYKRIANDPSMKAVSVSEFEKIVKKVFPAKDAAVILK